MAQPQRDGSGILFVNDRKQSDSHPDYKGSITINGQEYWLSGWRKQGQKGQFLSLSAQPKQHRQSNQGGGYQQDDGYGQGQPF